MSPTTDWLNRLIGNDAINKCCLFEACKKILKTHGYFSLQSQSVTLLILLLYCYHTLTYDAVAKLPGHIHRAVVTKVIFHENVMCTITSCGKSLFDEIYSPILQALSVLLST